MDYEGVVIEESLENRDVLGRVHMVSTKTEPVTEHHKTPWVEQWTLHTVEVPEHEAEKIAEQLAQALDSGHGHAWYADFKNDKTHFIIFHKKVFRVDRTKKEEYDTAVAYGRSLGIPGYQLDFSPLVKTWER